MKYKRKNDSNFWILARIYLHDYMPVVKNLSDKSVETYKQSLKTYLRFLEELKSLSNEQSRSMLFPEIMLRIIFLGLKSKVIRPKA